MKQIELIKKCIEKFAPKDLAEDWDNTGILVDCSFGMQDSRLNNKILLTIDLTEAVVDESIQKQIYSIVCYHPVIFHPMKSITSKTLIKCIQNGISVYSPHTQMDPLMNKFIMDKIGQNSISMQSIVKMLKDLSGLKTIRIVRGIESSKSSINEVYYSPENIKVGVGAAFRSVKFSNCLVITGEMSHHDMLQCKCNNVDVILMEHSNSERIFLGNLKSLMQSDQELENFEIFLSQKDCDPVEFI